MGQAGSNVLLLATRGDGNAGAAQDLDVANDGAQTAVEQTEAEILMREESALLASLGGEAQQASAAQADDAAVNAHLEIVVAGIEGQPDGDLLAGVEGLDGRLVSGDDQEPNLTKPELAVELL